MPEHAILSTLPLYKVPFFFFCAQFTISVIVSGLFIKLAIILYKRFIFPEFHNFFYIGFLFIISHFSHFINPLLNNYIDVFLSILMYIYCLISLSCDSEFLVSRNNKGSEIPKEGKLIKNSSS